MNGLRIQHRYLAAFCLVCSVTMAADWNITLPNEEDELWTNNVVECQGVGYRDADYELRIRKGALILAQTSGHTSDPEGEIEEHTFPTPEGGWPVGAAVVEVGYPGFPIAQPYYGDEVNVEFTEAE